MNGGTHSLQTHAEFVALAYQYRSIQLHFIPVRQHYAVTAVPHRIYGLQNPVIFAFFAGQALQDFHQVILALDGGAGELG